MRPYWFLFMLILATIGLAALFLPSVEAQAVSCQDQGTCQGLAKATASGVSGTRRFCWTTGAVCPSDGNEAHEASWEVSAGACISPAYRSASTGAVPPGAPSNVRLELRSWSGVGQAGTLVRTVHNGAEPSQGTTFQVCATSDGTASGAARAGTYHITIQASATGVGAYTVNSYGTGGDEVNWFRGALRANMLVSGITASSPPSGSTFAYGPAGDESVTATIGHTEPAVAQEETGGNVHLFQTVEVAESSIVQLSGSSIVEAFVIGDQFLEASVNYEIGLELHGTSSLTGLSWTRFPASGHGTGVIVSSDSFAFRQNQAVIDPRINVPSIVCGESLYNRGEAGECGFTVRNARNDVITKAVRVVTRDSNEVLLQNEDLTGSPKISSYAIQSGDDAVADGNGAQYTLQVAPLDTYALAATDSYSVSSLYLCDVHPQTMMPLIKDDFPTQDSAENETYFLGSNNIHVWGHVEGIRQDNTEIDTSGNALSFTLTRPNSELYSSTTRDTEADGWTATAWNETPVPPAGAWTLELAVAFSGNSCTDTEMVQYVSSFTENLVLRLLFNHTVGVGETVNIFVRAEVDDQAAVPGGVPILKVSRVNYETVPFEWEDVVTATPMLNVVDYTATVDGSLYQFNLTVSEAGTYNIWVRAPLNSAPIRESSNLLTASTGAQPLTTEFQESIGLTAPEFAIFPLLAMLGIYLWTREGIGVRLFGTFLVAFDFVLLLGFYSATRPWIGLLALAPILVLMFGYMSMMIALDVRKVRGAGGLL